VDRPKRGFVPRTELDRHPALRAWDDVCGKATRPSAIEILKPEKRESAVYRLDGVGPSGAAVIAKRRRQGDLDMERRLYTEVFPLLRVGTLAVYGSLEAEDGYSWLFLEDAGETWYSPKAREHVILAAEWLAALHTAAADNDWLPRTGSEFQRRILQRAQAELSRCLEHPALRPDDVETLELILRWLRRAEERWVEVEPACGGVPDSLVHGDFVPKNVRVRGGDSRDELVAFDWETSGWGSPSVDLGLLPARQDALRAYLRVVRSAGWELQWSDLVRLRTRGVLVRLIRCVEWETRSFRHEWIERAMRHMIWSRGESGEPRACAHGQPRASRRS
jgi:hypothetical protein